MVFVELIYFEFHTTILLKCWFNEQKSKIERIPNDFI